MSSKQRFRADIQGLRALAVLPVVAYHAIERIAPGGFFGVDIFFVISGYLITHILLREMEAGEFSLANFYARRVRRLFPALYVMLGVTMVAGIALLPPADLKELAATTLATIFFFSNFKLMHLSGYFDGLAALKPLLHTWSLAVEEQFYLFFPLFLFVVVRHARKWLSPILWACTILSFALATWMLWHNPLRAFYVPQARAYELLIGALLATGSVPRLKDTRTLDALSVLGLGLILFSIFGLDSDSATVWPAAIVACLGAGLVIYGGQERDSLGGRLISGKALVLIGTISYSLYLWHWPVLVFARYLTLGQMPAPVLIGAVVAGFILAYLSWRFVEEPVRLRRFTQTSVLAGGGITIAIASALTMAVFVGRGLPDRFDPHAQRLFAGQDDSSPYRAHCHSGGAHAIPYERNCVLGDPKAVPHVVLWGDSFGAELAVALGEQLAPRHASIMQITASACPPSLGHEIALRPNCAADNRRTVDRIKADPRIDHVILVSNYTRYGPAERERLFDGFVKVAEELRAANKRITLVYPIPGQTFDVPKALGMLAAWHGDYRDYGTPWTDYVANNGWVIQGLDALAAKVQADRIVPARRLCAEGVCRTYADGVGPLYFDDNHLSMAGARYVLGDAPSDLR